MLATLLGVGPDSRVGTVLSRWDQISRPVAALTARLTAFAADPALAAALARGGVPALPLSEPSDLPPGAFDLLILYQLCEWATLPLAPPRARAAAALRPRGVLCLAVATPWLRLAPYRALLVAAAVLAGGERDSLRAWAASWGREVRRRRLPSPRAYRAALWAAGLSLTGQFAPFPLARYPQFVIPLDAPGAAAHVFRSLLPRPNLLLAAAWELGALAAGVGLLAGVAPHLYLIARKPGTSPDPGAERGLPAPAPE